MKRLVSFVALTAYLSLAVVLSEVSNAAAYESAEAPDWFQKANVEPEIIKWTLKAVNCRKLKGRFSDIQLRRADTNDKLMELNRHYDQKKPDFSISIRAWLGALEIRSGNAKWSAIGPSYTYRWNREISREILKQMSQTGELSLYIKIYRHPDYLTQSLEDMEYIVVHHENKIENPEEIGQCLFQSE